MPARTRFNPAVSSRDDLVPELVALIMTLTGALLTALVIARERERGTMEALTVTRVSVREILLSTLLPYFLLGMGGMAASVLMAVVVFGVRLRGGLLPLCAGLVLFVLAVCGMGVAISSLAAMQQQALLGALLFMVPSVILSGFATPIASMPGWVQALTLLNPLRYFLIIVRGVFIEGADASVLLPQFWPMAVIAFTTHAAAGWLFRSRRT